MPRTILIVDDNAVERGVLAGFWGKEYKVLTAESGEDMFSTLDARGGDVSAILLDLLMPGMDGFSALGRLRREEAYRQIPVIVTTALTDEKSQVRAMALGANGYVFKPFNKQLLAYTLANAISLHEKSALVSALGKDELTGLNNREAFFARAQDMIREKEAGYYILSCLDIENFKVINDQYGVETGDEVLKNVAGTIVRNITAIGGVCCRYSADRFGMLYPADRRDSDEIRALHDKALVSGQTGRSVKIRIGRYLVDDLSVPVNAMYDRATLAEESIRGRYDTYIAEYTDSMRIQLLREQQIVSDMEGALKNGEFEPWLQPQFNHATGALIGAEALVRWKKDGKYVSPAEFVPVFERNGFIYEMDQYIWERVCALLRRWTDEGKAVLPVSVNISRRDLFYANFTDTITGLARKYRIPYSLLRLEVTESAFAEASGQIVAKVNELIKLGFTVEIDDFGSGYSSLNTLKDVPASILKLDMKFFENTKNQQRGGNIVQSVVRMAKWLGMAVISEGVEDKEQADYLKSIGCYYIQGYYYARPMPVAEYEKLLAGSSQEAEITRLQTLKTLDNNEFWNPKSMETLIFNSYVGGACIFEYSEGKTELLRVSEQYARELGQLMPEGARLGELSILRFLDEENEKLLFQNIRHAIEGEKESTCELTLSDASGPAPRTEYIRSTVRVIARAGERYLFYCVVVNVTAQREAEIRRRAAEKKQMESARQLEVIMANVNGGVSAMLVEKDGAFRFLFTNERYYDLYGYTREQAEKACLDVRETILPEDLPRVMEEIKKLKADREPAIIDYRITRRDGKLAYLRANASLMDMEGCGEVIISVVTDVTKARALEEQLRAVIDNIWGGVSATVVRDGKPEFVVVNDQFFKILGYETRAQYEAECQDKYARIYPEDRERIVRQFETSDGGKKQYTMEYRVVRRDGVVRYIRNNISVISLFGVEGAVQLSVANDITDQRLAQRKQREAVDKLSAVLNHAGNGITALILHEGRARVLFANRTYFEIMGCTRGQYRAATKDDMLALVHPDDRENVRARVRELTQNGLSATIDYRALRPDGRCIWVRTVITVTRFAGIEDPVQISMFSDITSQKEASEQLAFLNDCAHDILAQPGSDIAIGKTLDHLMAYFAGDRAYVIEIDYEKKESSNTYERCAPGVTQEISRLQNVPFSVSQAWFDLLGQEQFVVIKDVRELGDDQKDMRALLLAQHIISLIVAPLMRDGQLVGFVGIDNPKRATDQLNRLAALGDYIAILLTRRDLRAKIDSDQKMMAALMDDTPGGFVRMRMEPSGVFVPVYANEGFRKLVGMNREQLMDIYAENALLGVHPDDRDIVQSAAKRMLLDGEAESARFRVRSGTGKYIWLTLYGRMTRDVSGHTYLNVYYSDAARQMHEEQRQKELLDNLPCGAALYEYGGESLSVVHINKRYWQLVGRDPTDYSQTSVMGVIHPDDRAMVIQEIQSAIRQKRNVEVSIRILCGSGVYRPFHISANLRQKEGKYLFFAAYTPISERSMSMQEMLPIALSTMMSVSQDLSYVKDRDLRYICCSQSFSDLLGLASARDIIGKSDFDLFERKLAEKFIAGDARVVGRGEPLIGCTEEVATPKGGIRLVSTSKYPILDASGSVVGLYCVSRDITSQRQKESQLELLAGSVPGGLATYAISDEGLKMLYCNDGFCAFSGYGREEYADLVAQDPLLFVFEEDKPRIREMIRGFAQHREDGHVNGCVFRCHTRDGGYRWMSMKTVLSRVSEDRYVVGVVQLDITEQQEEKERLRVSEEFNRLAIEQSGNIITRFDVAARTLTLPESFNPIFVLPRVLNNMPEEQIALGRVSPDTAKAYRELFEGIVRGQASGKTAYKQNSSKGWRWLEAQYTTVFSSAGKPVSAVISFTDITEKLEKEVVYNKWRQSLKERAEDSYTLFRCNLSKDASFDSKEGALLDVTFGDGDISFDERTRRYADMFVCEEDRQAYLAFLRADTLLADYYRGRRSGTLEYREMRGEGRLRWLRLSVDLVEYPSSRDVEAYLMYEDIDQQKRADLLTRERSEKDPLTGILNRAAFIDKMDGILGEGAPGQKHALLMLDVDNFKHVNDTLGHGAGDQVLRELTRRIGAILRRGDLIGRLGGDEFFVFLRDIPGEAAAANTAMRICELRVQAEGADTVVTASIGIAMIPKDGIDFDTLYRRADHALYQCKKRGKNGYLFA